MPDDLPPSSTAPENAPLPAWRQHWAGALFEQARDGLLVLDAQGRLIDANAAAQRLLGAPPGTAGAWEGSGLSAWLQDSGADGACVERLLRRHDGSTCAVEVQRHAVPAGEPGWQMMSLRDISQRRALEAELGPRDDPLAPPGDAARQTLRLRQQQLEALLDLCPDGLVAFDTAQRVVFANPAFARQSGLRADEVVGLGEAAFSERLRQRSAPSAPFPGVAELRAEHRRDQVALADADAPPRRLRFEWTGAGSAEVALYLGRLGPVSQLLVLRDLTRSSGQERVKSEFLDHAAQELRTPMTSIFGYAELLRLRDYPPAQRAELAAIIARQCEWMLDNVNALMALARLESQGGADAVLERLPLRELVDQTLAGFVPPPGRAAPQVDDDGETRLVSGDRQRLRLALLTLLDNAYRYSPAGGDVRLQLCREHSAQHSRVGVRVVDPGIGLSPEQLARVGERFYRVDSSGLTPGTGLGVALVKEIASQHRGLLTLDSELGRGTQATLWLPSV